jgi:hypothetical protein
MDKITDDIVSIMYGGSDIKLTFNNANNMDLFIKNINDNKISTYGNTITMPKNKVKNIFYKKIQYDSIKHKAITVPAYKKKGKTVSGGRERSFDSIKAAGIIPYDIVNGNIYVLLGRHPYNGWTYFGGHKEPTDRNPRETAYREAKEESCKMTNADSCWVPFKQIIHKALITGKCICIPMLDTKYPNKKSQWNNFYFIKIDMKKWYRKYGTDIDIPKDTIKADEVNMIKWHTVDTILNMKYGVHGVYEMIKIILRRHKHNIINVS